MINPTTDYKFIKSVVTHPQVWSWVSDDFCHIDDFEPDIHHLYLEVVDGERMGFFALKPINSIMWEIHTTMLPQAWGKTIDYAKSVLVWIFENTNCQKVVTFVPENNAKALKLAEKSGMTLEGFIQDSWLKNGQLHGQYILGVARSTVCRSQQR